MRVVSVRLRRVGKHAPCSDGVRTSCRACSSRRHGTQRLATFIPPDGLLSASVNAAKIVCLNGFIAKRDAAAVIRSDVEFALPRVVKRLKIAVDTANQRVEVAYRGLFAKRYAQYAEGRGCTLVSKDEIPDRVAPPLPPATSDALWPTGERVQLSDNKRLLAALNDAALQGPGMLTLGDRSLPPATLLECRSWRQWAAW